MNHLENLIRQYYEWQGYIVRSNIKVGKLAHGGWEGELDVVAFHPETKHLIHLEPSIDANPWDIREKRFTKKFNAGEKYIRNEVFPWVSKDIPIEQVAVLITSTHKELGGGKVKSIDEFTHEVVSEVEKQGKMRKNAIPEHFDLLRTIQLIKCGYSNSGYSGNGK